MVTYWVVAHVRDVGEPQSSTTSAYNHAPISPQGGDNGACGWFDRGW